jgi:hypothetical protein
MLQKISHEAIEQVRSDDRVREAFRLYRAYTEDNDFWIATWWLAWGKKKRDLESDTFNGLIPKIAKVYHEVTGRSPLTTDALTGKHPFGDFVQELFKREGLKPPAINAVRQALKRNK